MMTDKSNNCEIDDELDDEDANSRPEYWVEELQLAVRDLRDIVTKRVDAEKTSDANLFTKLLDREYFKSAAELFHEALERLYAEFKPGNVDDLEVVDGLQAMWEEVEEELEINDGCACSGLIELGLSMHYSAEVYKIGDRYIFDSLFGLDCSDASAPDDGRGQNDASSDAGELQTSNRVVPAAD